MNYVLERGYHFHGKEYSTPRANKLAKSVKEWVDDPNSERQVGFITLAPNEYVRAVTRVAVRCKKNNGQWGIGVLISSLSQQEIVEIMEGTLKNVPEPIAALLAYVYFYDQRGGGVETEIKEVHELHEFSRIKKDIIIMISLRFDAASVDVQFDIKPTFLTNSFINK